MKTHTIIFLLLSTLIQTSIPLFAQWDSLGYEHKATQIISNIPASDQIEVDAEGNVFLLGIDEGILYKYLHAHQYDTAIFAGGISTRDMGFLHPKKLALKNRQDFYLLDDLGRKIVLFDKELKVVESSDFFAISSNSSIGIPDEFEPLSFDISPAGETFVLNKTNNKVYKINTFGNIESAFGGLDYGEGSLYDPYDIQVSPDNRIYISDIERQQIQIFDMFGVFIQDHRMEIDWEWEHFHIHESSIWVWNSTQLCVSNLVSQKSKTYPLAKTIQLKDLYIGREIIYLLLENEVHLYTIKE